MTAPPSTLQALVETIIPADASPGGWEGDVRALLTDRSRLHRRQADRAVDHLCEALDQASGPAVSFADLTDDRRSRVFEGVARDPGVAEDAATVVRLCMEGYYGGSADRPPVGWSVVDYRPRPDGLAVPADRTVTGTHPDLLRPAYDYVVIGAGAGGGVCAQVIAASGASVLLVERGRTSPDSALRDDHLRGKRMAVYDPTAGPGAGNPRILALPEGREWMCDADAAGDAWGLNAMTLGGGTRLWQGMAWRFAPEDFAMASTYGVPTDSSLADWPISYTDLQSDYAAVEVELGVSGDSAAHGGPHRRSLPMPALAGDPVRTLLGAAATRLGWASGPIPFAINSVPRSGRQACVACHQCMGHTCPVDAKNGTHNTYIPRALASGCHLLMGGHATSIDHVGGTARSVHIVIDDGLSAPRRVDVRCGHVVVAAGAIETPRLLLASGLGNDHVGRHLHGHRLSMVSAASPIDLPLFRGPGHSIATTSTVHDGTAPVGGGVLFDMFSPYPLQFATMATALGAPAAYGAAHKAWMRTGLRRVVGVMGMGQEVATPDSRVSLHPATRDAHGMPAPLFHTRDHPASAENQRYLTARGIEWLKAAQCEDPRDVIGAFGIAKHRIPASEHSVGTARMGDNPGEAATNRVGRVHGTSNVLVGDGSLLPTGGGFNPGLTIMANARRVAMAWTTEL